MNLLALPPRSRLLAWLTLAALLLLASAFLRSFDRLPETQWTGYTGEARRNQLLAAQRLLEHYRVPTRTLTNLNELPPTTATLFLPTERLSLSTARSEALRKWVEDGGNLIVVTWTIKSEDGVDPLLDPLGIAQKFNPIDDDSQWDKLLDPAAHVATATIDGEALRVHFDPRYSLASAPATASLKVEDSMGVHAVTLPLGRGQLTVLTDAEFAANDSLGENDHAAFLWHLLSPPARSEVWLVRSEDLPALWKLIWQHAPAVVIALTVLLATFIWSRMLRFGPRLPAPTLTRRQLSEHIVASGWYLWQNQRGARLLDTLRALVRSRVPELATPDSDEAVPGKELKAVAGAEPTTVRRAMVVTDIAREEDFVDAVRTLETIRKQA